LQDVLLHKIFIVHLVLQLVGSITGMWNSQQHPTTDALMLPSVSSRVAEFRHSRLELQVQQLRGREKHGQLHRKRILESV